MERPEQQHVVLLLNLPPSSLCGVDLLSFTTSPQFLGLRGVPAGWHFVYISATQSSTIRHGLWIHVGSSSGSSSSINTSSGRNGGATAAAAVAAAAAAAGDVGDVVIKKFDAASEDLVDEQDTAERLRWRANLGAVWRERLAPYRPSASAGSSTTTSGYGGGGGGGGTAVGGSRQQRQQQRQQEQEQEGRDDWHNLTDCLTADLLTRVTTGGRGEGGGGKEAGGTGGGGGGGDSIWNNWRLNTASSAAQDVDDIPGLARDAVISEQHIYGAPRAGQGNGGSGGGGGGDAANGAGGGASGANAANAAHGGGEGAEDSGYKTGSGGELHFVPVDLKRTWRAGAIGRERTEAAQDRSWALGYILRTYCGGSGGGGGNGSDRSGDVADDGQALPSSCSSASSLSPVQQQQQQQPEQQHQQKQEHKQEQEQEQEKEQQERYLVGEMQLTFLMTLTLANYSCLQQWMRLLGLVLTCRAAVRERPALFARVLRLLQRQLHCSAEAVDGGLFDLSDEGGGFLIQLLKTFRRRLEEMGQEDEEEEEEEEEEAEEGSKGGKDGSGSKIRHSAGKRRMGGTHAAAAAVGIAQVRAAFAELEAFVRAEFGWELSDSYVRRGMLQLEDGEEVEMEVDELQGEDERGEYAPVIVTL
jgi:A1 cistron-splicing factor AAR2